MKNSFKQLLRKWEIGDYIRQFSIVTGGVLLTLWLTARISASSQQREVRQVMQLVTIELRDNLETIRKYKRTYLEESRISRRLKERDFSLDGLPADTIGYYTQQLTNGMGKPFLFRNDALELFKTTGVAADIADKQIIIGLLRCYKELEAFDNSMDFYYTQRKEAILPEQMILAAKSTDTIFEKFLSGEKTQNWLAMIPRAFNARYFEMIEAQIDATIAQIERRYR